MRIASYNVENMFRRPRAFDPKDKEKGDQVVEAYSEIQTLIGAIPYSDSDKKRILELLDVLGLKDADSNKWVLLRQNRGHLISRHKDGTVEVSARGRDDWVGWFELVTEAVNEVATQNTAGVIREVDADVLAVIEVEDRPTLERFNLDVLRLDPSEDYEESLAHGYRHVMLIDGNDDRGIDVGVLTRDQYPILQMRSHVDDGPLEWPTFSRDCVEHELPISGGRLLLMINHFKSKRGGGDEKREKQATRVAEIYNERRSQGWEQIVVAGDLNDTPNSACLVPLVEQTDLKDASEHETFEFGKRKGTYGTGNEKIDYLLLSPETFAAVAAGGVNRRGVWHGPRTKDPWELLPTLTKEEEAASDHAAIWVDLNL